MLAHLRPDVQSCPLLAPIVVILLHFMNESECFACAIGLLDSKRQMYFEHTHKGAAANQRSLTDVARSRAVGRVCVCVCVCLCVCVCVCLCVCVCVCLCVCVCVCVCCVCVCTSFPFFSLVAKLQIRRSCRQ